MWPEDRISLSEIVRGSWSIDNGKRGPECPPSLTPPPRPEKALLSAFLEEAGSNCECLVRSVDLRHCNPLEAEQLAESHFYYLLTDPAFARLGRELEIGRVFSPG